MDGPSGCLFMYHSGMSHPKATTTLEQFESLGTKQQENFDSFTL